MCASATAQGLDPKFPYKTGKLIADKPLPPGPILSDDFRGVQFNGRPHCVGQDNLANVRAF